MQKGLVPRSHVVDKSGEGYLKMRGPSPTTGPQARFQCQEDKSP